MRNIGSSCWQMFVPSSSFVYSGVTKLQQTALQTVALLGSGGLHLHIVAARYRDTLWHFAPAKWSMCFVIENYYYYYYLFTFLLKPTAPQVKTMNVNVKNPRKKTKKHLKTKNQVFSSNAIIRANTYHKLSSASRSKVSDTHTAWWQKRSSFGVEWAVL